MALFIPAIKINKYPQSDKGTLDMNKTPQEKELGEYVCE